MKSFGDECFKAVNQTQKNQKMYAKITLQDQD